MLPGCRDPLNGAGAGGKAVVTGCRGQALGEMDSELQRKLGREEGGR